MHFRSASKTAMRLCTCLLQFGFYLEAFFEKKERGQGSLFIPKRESFLYPLVVRLSRDQSGGIRTLRRGHPRIVRSALPLEYPGRATYVSGRREFTAVTSAQYPCARTLVGNCGIIGFLVTFGRLISPYRDT